MLQLLCNNFKSYSYCIKFYTTRKHEWCTAQTKTSVAQILPDHTGKNNLTKITHAYFTMVWPNRHSSSVLQYSQSNYEEKTSCGIPLTFTIATKMSLLSCPSSKYFWQFDVPLKPIQWKFSLVAGVIGRQAITLYHSL